LTLNNYGETLDLWHKELTSIAGSLRAAYLPYHVPSGYGQLKQECRERKHEEYHRTTKEPE
jgi:hypothetical protein